MLAARWSFSLSFSSHSLALIIMQHRISVSIFGGNDKQKSIKRSRQANGNWQITTKATRAIRIEVTRLAKPSDCRIVLLVRGIVLSAKAVAVKLMTLP
jgi:hypothetical protein